MHLKYDNCEKLKTTSQSMLNLDCSAMLTVILNTKFPSKKANELKETQ